MNRYPLSPDLQQLEQELQEQRATFPSAVLKQRILQQVSGELASRQKRNSAEERWSFAAAAALVTLVGMNLSLLTAQHSGYRLTPLESTSQTVSAAAQIEELLPCFSKQQALASALTLQSALALRSDSRLQRLSPSPSFSTTGDFVRVMNDLDL